MLKTVYPTLPLELQEDMARRQIEVNQLKTDGSEDAWKKFKDKETEKAKRGEPIVKVVLRNMFHDKCGYCETYPGTEIDHHWPKSPHSHNQNRGTPARMFQWENMIWSCHTCNGFECKGAHMRWDAQDNPMLLNPGRAEDDPFCYFSIITDSQDALEFGWIKPRTDLPSELVARAEYTIRQLKLNLREDLVKGRRRMVRHFEGYWNILERFGPDYEFPPGYTVRQRIVDLLQETEPCLTVIRQMLYTNDDLRQELIAMIPELTDIFSSWALPPSPCHTMLINPENS